MFVSLYIKINFMRKYLYIMFLLMLVGCTQQQNSYRKSVGRIFGTYYAVTYQSDEDLQTGIEQVLNGINSTFSTFDSSSIISKINRNVDVKINEDFVTVYNTAVRVSKQTNGAFDITVAPLVNLWGFGYDPKHNRTQGEIDSIMLYVGYDKISLKDSMIVKNNPLTCLDASAIAKGYACDAVAEYLKKNNINNFLIDIGGELSVMGKNPKGDNWVIGISKAIEDSTQTNSELERTLFITNKSIATSGNYRQYYITKERKVSHTIDPRTGYPTNHRLLSATVLASSCMLADAYATSMMVIGDTIQIDNMVKSSSNTLEWFLIVADSANVHHEVYSEGFKQYLR
ncbi:MAG: FAD:protein FMN transferase [Bacteroidia bacterium]|nr:FAD:protein FMN transferase [Bacteroidia bacterium]